jgi:hypothetical protein
MAVGGVPQNIAEAVRQYGGRIGLATLAPAAPVSSGRPGLPQPNPNSGRPGRSHLAGRDFYSIHSKPTSRQARRDHSGTLQKPHEEVRCTLSPNCIKSLRRNTRLRSGTATRFLAPGTFVFRYYGTSERLHVLTGARAADNLWTTKGRVGADHLGQQLRWRVHLLQFSRHPLWYEYLWGLPSR